MAGRRETMHKPVIACEKRAQTGSSAVSPWNEECACRGERILVFQLTTGVFLLLGLKRPCLEQRVNFSRRTFHDRGRGAPATCTCTGELRKSLQPLPNIALRALRISVTVTSRLERNLNSNVIFATSHESWKICTSFASLFPLRKKRPWHFDLARPFLPTRIILLRRMRRQSNNAI